jgi:hypothetical protein
MSRRQSCESSTGLWPSQVTEGWSNVGTAVYSSEVILHVGTTPVDRDISSVHLACLGNVVSWWARTLPDSTIPRVHMKSQSTTAGLGDGTTRMSEQKPPLMLWHSPAVGLRALLMPTGWAAQHCAEGHGVNGCRPREHLPCFRLATRALGN